VSLAHDDVEGGPLLFGLDVKASIGVCRARRLGWAKRGLICFCRLNLGNAKIARQVNVTLPVCNNPSC
jgi:hypothetical protein